MKFHRSLHPNSTAGYTLIEMMAIVIIIAVLAAIAAPSWLAYTTRQRMNAVESDLVQVLKQARETAISRRRTVTVEIDEAATIPTVIVDGSEQELGPGDLPDGAISLEALPADNSNATEIFFDYQGTARGQEEILAFVVDITPSNGNQRQCVAVATLLGNVKTAKDADCDNF